MAVQSGNKDLVEILQKYGAVITNDELNVAISQGNKELVNNLLSSGRKYEVPLVYQQISAWASCLYLDGLY